MKTALFSDIHANLEALEEAVRDAGKRNIGRYAVLGDTLGYGPNPNECFEWVLNHAGVLLMGNHEKAVFDAGLRDWFNDDAREAIEWTEGKLENRYKKILPDLAYVRLEKTVSFAHGSLHEPEEFHYLMNFASALPTFRTMESPLCFVGHTHVPCCFCEQKRESSRLEPGIRELVRGFKYVLNPGSVGQPRDGDPRLSYGIFDDEKYAFEIVRLPYENHKTAEKIRKAGLPAFLADRLL